jgi:hypothetical protein
MKRLNRILSLNLIAKKAVFEFQDWSKRQDVEESIELPDSACKNFEEFRKFMVDFSNDSHYETAQMYNEKAIFNYHYSNENVCNIVADLSDNKVKKSKFSKSDVWKYIAFHSLPDTEKLGAVHVLSYNGGGGGFDYTYSEKMGYDDGEMVSSWVEYNNKRYLPTYPEKTKLDDISKFIKFEGYFYKCN